MTALYFLAILAKASVLGPGMLSAIPKYLWSSLWQKYCDRNNSWVQMICAPCLAARSARASVFFRFVAVSIEAADWIRPSFTTWDAARFIYDLGLRRTVSSSTWVLPGTDADDGACWPNNSRTNLPSVSLVGP